MDQSISRSDYKFHLIGVQHREHHHGFTAYPSQPHHDDKGCQKSGEQQFYKVICSELICFQCYYLHGMKWPFVGLEPLAIVFSLTYALLMWSYVLIL